MADTLASTLNEPFSSIPVIGRINAGADTQTRAKTAREELPGLMGESEAAFGEQLTAAQEAKKAGAKGAAKAERQFATRTGEAISEFDQNLPQRPEFDPTEYDAGQAAVTAGLVGLMTAFGSRGRGRATLKAMKGWVDGANQGQKDVYNRELKDFEQNLSAWKDNMTIAKDRLNRIIDQYGRDKNAALVEAKLLETELGDGVIAAQIRQNNIKGALDYANKAIDLGNKIDVALASAAAKQKAGNLPPDLAKTYNALAPNFERFSRLNDTKTRNFFGIFPNETASRLFMKAVEVDLTPQSTEFLKKRFNINDEQILWWKDYDQFVAKVRNELFGATLTKAEKENFDRTIITPATSPDTAIKFFNEQVGIINRAVNREVAKGMARGVDPEVISAYLGVDVGRMAQPRPVGAPEQNIQSELSKRNLPYEPDKYNYGFENGRFYREPK